MLFAYIFSKIVNNFAKKWLWMLSSFKVSKLLIEARVPLYENSDILMKHLTGWDDFWLKRIAKHLLGLTIIAKGMFVNLSHSSNFTCPDDCSEFIEYGFSFFGHINSLWSCTLCVCRQAPIEALHPLQEDGENVTR